MSSTKTDKELQDALNKFRAMDRETAHEAAHTYLLSVLNSYSEEEIQKKWIANFENKTDLSSEANSLLQKIVEKKDESDALIRLAVETTLKSEPDTRRQFIEAVQNAGEKQFVLEIAILVLAAATMINTLYAKGKAREITEEEFDKDGNKTKRRVNIEYASNGPLAGLLSKIWPAGTLS